MSAILDAIRRFFYPFGVAFLGRGEVAEAPDPVDAHAATYDPLLWRPRCTGVFAGSDLIDSTVPADAGEQLAEEIQDYLRSIR